MGRRSRNKEPMHEAAFQASTNGPDRWSTRDSATHALARLRTTNYWPMLGYGAGGLVLTLALLAIGFTDYEFGSLYEAVGAYVVSTVMYGLILYAAATFVTSLFRGVIRIIRRAWPKKPKETLLAPEDVPV